MPRIIIDLPDSNRLNTDILMNIESSIVNYLLHDYSDLFETRYHFDLDGVETELPGMSMDTQVLNNDYEILKDALTKSVPEKYASSKKGYQGWTDIIYVHDGNHAYRNLEIGFNSETGTFSWIEINSW